MDDNDAMDAAERTILCPYCDYARRMPADRLPSRPVAATCPKCNSRFMFTPEPAAQAGTSGENQQRGATNRKYRSDYDLIKEEFFSFYSNGLKGHKGSVRTIVLLFVLYGLMYFIVTSIYYLYGQSGGRHVSGVADYLPGFCAYVLFFPVMVMHSWKFIGVSQNRLADQLSRYSSTFVMVAISYAVLLYITTCFFARNEMALALTIPVIGSALVPSLLHALIDSL